MASRLRGRRGVLAERGSASDSEARSLVMAEISYWSGYHVVLDPLPDQLDVVMGMIDAELDDAA